MVIDASSARERVRLILDRANSPWLTDTEINGFIEMALNEYVRERVNMFGANQKLRDDFGQYVKSIMFSNQATSSTEIPGTDIIRRQFVNYSSTGALIPDQLLPFLIPGGEYANDSLGVACKIADNEDDTDTEFDSINFGYLVEIKIFTPSGSSAGGIPVKVMNLDDALTIKKDPFHKADLTSGEYHAVRVNNYYYVRPVNVNSYVIMTYVSNNNDAENISWLPIHGREEVCQIAARKIMGTVADERYPTGDVEIKQLEGK